MTRPGSQRRIRARSPARVLALMILVSTLALAPSASASQPCAGILLNYFDGFNTRTLTTYGSKAYITTRPGATCTGGQGASAAWAMLASNYASGYGGYAQSGYADLTTHPNRYFSQWRRSSQYAPVTVWGGAPSSGQYYSTYYNFDTGRIRMFVGGTLYDTTNFDPNANIWPKPWDSQFFGETFWLQDDMPGTAVTHAVFSEIRYVTQRGGPWVAVPSGTFHVDGSRYHYTGNTSLFGIWTDPLQ